MSCWNFFTRIYSQIPAFLTIQWYIDNWYFYNYSIITLVIYVYISGDDHLARRMDVSKSSDVAATFDTIKEKYYSPPNVIVNVAGILKDNFLLKISEEDFDKVFAVNLKVILSNLEKIRWMWVSKIVIKIL